MERKIKTWIGLGLALLLTAGATGCAQLRGGRHSEAAPKIGTTGPATFDPYLAHHKSIQKTPDARALASNDAPDLSIQPLMAETSRSTAHPATDSALPRSGGTSPVLVDLEPPISLPIARNEPEPKRLAAAPVDKTAKAREILAKSRAKVNGMAVYQVSLNRTERVGDVLQPAEDLLLSIRRQPRAVRLEWPSGSHKGREVLFSASDPSGMMHINMADSIVPIPKISIPPDSPLAMKASRHPITEAGFDTIITQVEASLSTKTVVYSGVETPREVARPCHKLVRQTPTGETWIVHIDAETDLPAMVQASTKSGDLLEKYTYKDVKTNVPELLTAAAFDANGRWGNSTGLLGRLARATGTDKPTAAPVTR